MLKGNIMNYQKKFLTINLILITFAYNNLFGMYQSQPNMQHQPIQIHINTASSWFSLKNILIGGVILTGFALYYKFRGQAFNEIKNEIKQGTNTIQNKISCLSKKNNKLLSQVKKTRNDIHDDHELLKELHDGDVIIMQQNEGIASRLDILEKKTDALAKKIDKVLLFLQGNVGQYLQKNSPPVRGWSYARQAGLY